MDNFKIMLASGAAQPLRFAAEELCKFIEKSMGFIPEIRGKINAGVDLFLIKKEGNPLLLQIRFQRH